MTFDPKFEIGADYSGMSSRHFQYNEVHDFTSDAATRIFMPNNGSFYVDSLKILDSNTGQPLTSGGDGQYTVFILDDVATEKSGKQVCGLIDVTDPNVGGVILEYNFVGGLHTTGYYLLRQLLLMYPNGINSVLHWDEVLNKPDEWDPAFHRHNVRELFKTDSWIVWIERIRCGVVEYYRENLNNIYDLTQARFDNLYATMAQRQQETIDAINAVFAKLQIQGEEYILTDNPNNPGLTRDYGNWEMITDAVLYSQNNAFIVGSGSMIDMGSEQCIRNTYVWKNVSAVKPKVVVTANKTTISENEAITFTVQTTNLTGNRPFAWQIVGADGKDIVGGLASGTVTTNGSGTATVTITYARDQRTEGTKGYRFVLTDFSSAYVDFLVLDTSRTKLAFAEFRKNGELITQVNETDIFQLYISAQGLGTNTLSLTWSGLTPADFVTQPPTSITVTDNATIPLEIRGNITPGDIRKLTVDIKDLVTDVTPLATATVAVIDNTEPLIGRISFVSNGALTTTVNEGSTFQLRVKTNRGVGEQIDFAYTSNKALTEFSGLPTFGIIDANYEIVSAISHLVNNATATELEYLEVTATHNGVLLDTRRINFVDTSKTPGYVAHFSSDEAGTLPITSVNEGQNFYFIMSVPNWVATNPSPLNDFDYQINGVYTTLANMQARVTGGYYGQLKFDGTNGKSDVKWLNNNTLSIKFTAVADLFIKGDVDFSVRVKPNAISTWEVVKSIRIEDTSNQPVSVSWSSSPTVLTPITSIEEMEVTGLGKTAYLWISVTDVTGFGLITIEATGTVTEADLTTVFPITANFDANKRIIKAVGIKPDFTQEGNEQLTANVYYTGNKGVKRLIGQSSITIIDNSTQLDIDVTLTHRNSYPVDGDGAFSEWGSGLLAATYNLMINTDTTIKAEIVYADTGAVASDRFTIAPNATQTLAANTTDLNFYLNYVTGTNPTYDTRRDYLLRLKRYDLSGNQISEDSVTPFKLQDDRHPQEVYLDIYDTDGNLVTALQEGKYYNVRFTAINADIAASMFINLPYATTQARDANSEYYGLDEMSSWYVAFQPNKKLRTVSAVIGWYNNRRSVQSWDYTLFIARDRATNLKDRYLRIVGVLDNNYRYSSEGTPYPSNALDPVQVPYSVMKASKEYFIEDTSQSLDVTYEFRDGNGNVKTSFNEGETLIIRANYAGATPNDRLLLQLAADSDITLSRFTIHQFNQERTMTAESGYVEWSHVIKNNLFTDGDEYLGFQLYMSGSGERTPVNRDVKIIDTSRIPSVQVELRSVGATMLLDTMYEGLDFIITAYYDALIPNGQFKMLYGSGRPASDFTTLEVDMLKAPVWDAAKGKYKADFIVFPKSNWITDTVKQINLIFATEANGTTYTDGVEIPFLIDDTTRTPGFTKIEWRDSPTKNGGNIITSVNEGSTAYLHAYGDGGDYPLQIKCTNEGGRDIQYMTSQKYGSTLSRTNDTTPLVIAFAPSNDFRPNVSPNNLLSVKLEYVAFPGVSVVATLPVNDTSTTSTASITPKIKNPDNSYTNISSIDEGKELYIDFSIFGAVAGRTYRIEAITTHALDGATNWNGNNIDGKEITWFTLFTPSSDSSQTNFNNYRIVIRADETTNLEEDLQVLIRVRDITLGTVLSSTVVTINDTSVEPVVLPPTIELSVTDWSYSEDTEGPVYEVWEGSEPFVKLRLANYVGAIGFYWDGPTEINGTTLIAEPVWKDVFTDPTEGLYYYSWPLSYTEQGDMTPLYGEWKLILAPTLEDLPDTYSSMYDPAIVVYPVTINKTTREIKVVSVWWALDAQGTEVIDLNTPVAAPVGSGWKDIYLFAQVEGLGLTQVVFMDGTMEEKDFAIGQNPTSGNILGYSSADYQQKLFTRYDQYRLIASGADRGLYHGGIDSKLGPLSLVRGFDSNYIVVTMKYNNVYSKLSDHAGGVADGSNNIAIMYGGRYDNQVETTAYVGRFDYQGVAIGVESANGTARCNLAGCMADGHALFYGGKTASITDVTGYVPSTLRTGITSEATTKYAESSLAGTAVSNHTGCKGMYLAYFIGGNDGKTNMGATDTTTANYQVINPGDGSFVATMNYLATYNIRDLASARAFKFNSGVDPLIVTYGGRNSSYDQMVAYNKVTYMNTNMSVTITEDTLGTPSYGAVGTNVEDAAIFHGGATAAKVKTSKTLVIKNKAVVGIEQEISTYRTTGLAGASLKI